MGNVRADLGFGSELENFDPDEWEPKPKMAPKDQSAAKAAAATGFKSREGRGQAPKVTQRRRRTGRNAQFNIKAKPETIEAFCHVADAQGWGLGETLEFAVELLKKQYGSTR